VERKIQLRSIAPESPDLGRLAPPRDAPAARAQRRRERWIAASVTLIVGGAVMLGIWFLGRR
jgi:hypothetical protein